ncbi:MAG: Alpha-D-ribose 1-methylphosphonate 5-triphosphate diphosphatase [Fibrobacterota bacterium]|jgi:alpha-D-ribose 1-methylphosphonate 5-triphosphate diphosphatase
MTDFVINHCKAVLADSVLEDASVRIEDGHIVEIVQGKSLGFGVEARDAWLLPGFVDMHSDAVEKAVEPRPKARFPVEVALRELDRSLAGWGITTIYHSLSFAEMELGLRSNATANELIDGICDIAPLLRVNTRIHARFEITDIEAVPLLKRQIDKRHIDLLSFMDHSPGQGQYRDTDAYKSYYGKVYAKSEAELEQMLKRKADAHERGLEDVVADLADHCRKRWVPMASHDDDCLEKIQWCVREGVAMSEFPISIETARQARDAGIKTCLGSPNLVRGGSQAGNLSARTCLEAGFGDILCSDYLPQSILHAVFLLKAWGVRPLHEAVAMASIVPAQAVGIGNKTGSIEVGKHADLLLVAQRHGHPDILHTWVRGREVYASC